MPKRTFGLLSKWPRSQRKTLRLVSFLSVIAMLFALTAIPTFALRLSGSIASHGDALAELQKDAPQGPANGGATNAGATNGGATNAGATNGGATAPQSPPDGQASTGSSEVPPPSGPPVPPTTATTADPAPAAPTATTAKPPASTAPAAPKPAGSSPSQATTSTSRGGYDRSRPLAGRVIVVDPGHGPVGSGAQDNGSDEATNVLAIGFKLRALLEGAGAKVIMTRTTMAFAGGSPGTEQLAARTTLANRSRADIFVSIHNNWYDDPRTRGSMTFYSRRDDGSAALAGYVQDALIASTGAYDHGTEPANYYVVKYTTMPAILVESGFLSNAADAAQDRSDSYQSLVAQGIFRGIINYFANH